MYLLLPAIYKTNIVVLVILGMLTLVINHDSLSLIAFPRFSQIKHFDCSSFHALNVIIIKKYILK